MNEVIICNVCSLGATANLFVVIKTAVSLLRGNPDKEAGVNSTGGDTSPGLMEGRK